MYTCWFEGIERELRAARAQTGRLDQEKTRVSKMPQCGMEYQRYVTVVNDSGSGYSIVPHSTSSIIKCAFPDHLFELKELSISGNVLYSPLLHRSPLVFLTSPSPFHPPSPLIHSLLQSCSSLFLLLSSPPDSFLPYSPPPPPPTPSFPFPLHLTYIVSLPVV